MQIQMSDTVTNYIYLLQEREFIKTKENVYKVGMTKKEHLTRFNQYPKGSVLLIQLICNNCKLMETQIIKKFKECFNQTTEYGNEYFKGNYIDMIDIICYTIKNEMCNVKYNDEIVPTVELETNDALNNDMPILVECCSKQPIRLLKHINDRKMSMFNTKTRTKINGYFTCESCDFECSKQSNYNTHLLTSKHTKGYEMICQSLMPKNAVSIFKCQCGKIFTYNSGLWRHKKMCQYTDTIPDALTDKQLIMKLLQENTEMRKAI